MPYIICLTIVAVFLLSKYNTSDGAMKQNISFLRDYYKMYVMGYD